MKILLKNKYLFGVIVAFLATATSCDKKEAYHQFQDIKNASWSKTDSANFLIDTTCILPESVYDIQLEVVNNTQFHYQNMWLFVRSNIENEKVFRQDTIQVKLADIYGKWIGSGFGSYYQTATPFRQKVVFSQKRNYTIQVIQGMRDEPLTGIEKVGLRISRSQ